MPPHQAPSGLGRLHLQLPPEVGAPAAARQALRNLPLGECADDVALLVSELVTNAVEHADTYAPIELSVACEPGHARVEVVDHGRGFKGRGAREGYGMQMLDAATESWGIDEDGATAVWFEISDPPPGRAAPRFG